MRWSLFFTKSWKWCFLSSFDYTFVQENTIKHIFQNAICEVIVFSNKTPIGQSDFTIARCVHSKWESRRIVKNKQECLFQNRNFRYLFVCLVYLFVLFFMTKEVSAGSTKYSGDIDIWLLLWIKMIWTCTSILSIAIARN